MLDGWDISKLNLADAMKRAEVLEVALQDQVAETLAKLTPRPSIYDPDFIAANQVRCSRSSSTSSLLAVSHILPLLPNTFQSDRADNLIAGTRQEQFEQIRADIRDFKQRSAVDVVIVLWTANTERFSDVRSGLNATFSELQQSLSANDAEVSPSTIFAMAAIAERCTYINGSPQNTFVPGVLEMAEQYGVFVAGDDFKSGQTKIKSVLVDFLVGAGIKPVSIVSYNHLGNNDGKNLSAPSQFRSKEISKSNVVDDMVASNALLYARDEHPDHVVVIKYVPYVGDSKRAMDEYTSEIMMGGHNTLVIHNTCEDSLLATPLILDLVVLAELCARIQVGIEYYGRTRVNHLLTSAIADQTRPADGRIRDLPSGAVHSQLPAEGAASAGRHTGCEFAVPSAFGYRKHSARMHRIGADLAHGIGAEGT